MSTPDFSTAENNQELAQEVSCLKAMITLMLQAMGQADAGRVIIKMEKQIAQMEDEAQAAVFSSTVKEVAIKWSAAPDMTPQTVLYRRPVAQFSNFQPKIVSSWLILALFQANFLISGRSRLCPYQLVNSNQVRQGE